MRGLGTHGSARLTALAVAVVAFVAIAMTAGGAAAKPQTVEAGNLLFTFDGGFSPATLPKNTLAPITLSASGKIATKDGTHPPALKEVLVETDKNGAVDVKGYPTCKGAQLQSRDSRAALKVCKPALIGNGATDVEIALEEQTPIIAHSELLVFNGGEKGGVITFYIHAYITVPTPAAVVTTVKIKKIHHGRFGLLSVASIPKIAGGAGSVRSFSLKIGKTYTYKGSKVSILSAKCADGKLQAHATSVFTDGTEAAAEIVRPCTGKR